MSGDRGGGGGGIGDVGASGPTCYRGKNQSGGKLSLTRKDLAKHYWTRK